MWKPPGLQQTPAGVGMQECLRDAWRFRYAISAALRIRARDEPLQPLFVSSGDLIADRRYELGARLCGRAAISRPRPTCLAQAVELAPGFAAPGSRSARSREQLGDRDGAIAAFAAGARRRSARTVTARGCISRGSARPTARRRCRRPMCATLFDQYAPDFDARWSSGWTIAGRDAAAMRCRRAGSASAQFGTMLDLGCGTGLAGAAFRPHVDWLVGVDLSPAMIEQARGKGIYDRLAVARHAEFLAAQAGEQLSILSSPPTCSSIARDLAPIARRWRACWRRAGCSPSRSRPMTAPASMLRRDAALRARRGACARGA